ncbi:oligosaccharide flippase family protein [Pseudoalteromonas sp. JC3]|uniref:lipopolysaccharide biosynthesis protein n=1 Tax=Pseudoalteromonas sp. JC3 TaxID=2810196 RepID=UPI0019D05A8B|nr:oligosaccharide flippase family protein [Pseudoalteromonas sp. JC3]MBR8842460.1 oligosaccharide flippase family protein [Pseudoalteromonas sp. JC3]WJE09421.1 oligosaccharide flippase family protein [Pseudoalteromonas sp. JC3]
MRLALPLVIGSGVGQIITLLITPLLTRYYSDVDFGEWAFFLAITTVIITGSAFRYDLSILLPSSKKDALRLSVVSVKNILVTTFVSCAFVFCFYLFNPIGFESLYLFIPISVLVGGINLVLTANLNYKKEYKLIAFAKLYQTLSTVCFNLVFCFYSAFSFDGSGLVLATILGQLVCLVYLKYYLNLTTSTFIRVLNIKYSKKLATKYYDFAVYSLPACLIGCVLTSFPVYMLEFLFSTNIVGQYSLANRVLMTPLMLVGTGLSQVFFKHFSEKVASQECILVDFYRIWLSSLAICIIPATLVYIFAEPVSQFIFGEQWSVAGQIISLLIFPIILNFCINLVSSSHAVLRLQHLALYFSILMLLGKMISSYLYSEDYTSLLLFYALVDLFAVLIMNAIVVYKLRGGIWKS